MSTEEQGSFDEAFDASKAVDENDAAYTITYLEIVSFKRLRAFRITPDGEMVVIGGWNKQGKSSILDGIHCLLNGKASVPALPIHEGKRRGKILAKFQNKLGDHFTAERTFDAKTGATELHVRDKDGETPLGGEQTFLNTLLGGPKPLAFDPAAFVLMDDKQQDAICRKLCGVDFTDHNARRKALEGERKTKNAEFERLKHRHAEMPEHDDAPSKELDATEISKQLGELTTANAERAERQRVMDAKLGEIERQRTHVFDLRSQLADAESAFLAAEKEKNELPAVGDAQDVAPLQAKLTTLTATNAKVRANAEREKAREAYEKAEEESDALTEKMKEIDDEKAELLAKATYPVPGMGFDEIGPTLNGYPIKQASDREKIELGVAIAFQQNPGLRIALVRAGSFFDPPALRALAETMKSRGGQAWVEVVRVDDCDVVIEDGEERKAPEPQPVVQA